MSINSLHGLQKKIDEADEHGQENDGHGTKTVSRGENERDEVESRKTREEDGA
jgi:hypothetical protein